MNRKFFTTALFVVIITTQAWATSSPYPNPYRQTMWNSLTDKIHTLGQTPKKAALTTSRLHHKRNLARIHSINHAKQQAWVKSQNP